MVRSEPCSHRILYDLPHRSTEVSSKIRTLLLRRSFSSFLLSSWLFVFSPSFSFSPPQWIFEAGLSVGQERVNSSADCCLCCCCCCCGGVDKNNFAWPHSDTRIHARTPVCSPRAPNLLGSHERWKRPSRGQKDRQAQKTRQPSLRQATRKSKLTTTLFLFHPFL